MRTTGLMLLGAVTALLSVADDAAGARALSRLKVSEDGRFLVHADGSPFFYLADTAWELTHRLEREEIGHYLRTRAAQGFTVIQTVVLAEFDGLRVPNAYGETPLIDNDPLRPNLRYFDLIDWTIAEANALGLRVGLLPTWGDKWNRKWGVGPEIFTPENAAGYGEWLGRRYRRHGVIWIVGGDRPIETDAHRAIVSAMAQGLRRGDGGAGLITYHPSGGNTSAQWFHDAEWLDFNLRQNGHEVDFHPRYAQTRADYDRVPPKPVIDGEPVYEAHPIAFKAQQNGHSTSADVRRPLYWDLFSGACGHTYGHHSVWQFYDGKRAPVNMPLATWREALESPGGRQMRYARWLLESRPLLTRVPDDDILVAGEFSSAMPGAGRYRFVATRDGSGSFAMVYAPVGRPFSVRLGRIAGARVRAWWFNPRNGEATAAGEFANDGGELGFVSPTPGENVDWVLVLDDVARNFPPPGTRAAAP